MYIEYNSQMTFNLDLQLTTFVVYFLWTMNQIISTGCPQEIQFVCKIKNRKNFDGNNNWGFEWIFYWIKDSKQKEFQSNVCSYALFRLVVLWIKKTLLQFDNHKKVWNCYIFCWLDLLLFRLHTLCTHIHTKWFILEDKTQYMSVYTQKMAFFL